MSHSLSIGKKLVGSYLLIFVFVLICGIMGIYMMNTFVETGGTVLKNGLAVTHVSKKAIISVQNILNRLGKIHYIDNNPDRHEDDLDLHFLELNMYIDMLWYGTKSEKFLKRDSGKRYTQKGLKIVVPKADGKRKKRIEEIILYKSELKDQVKKIVDDDKNKTKHAITFLDKKYALRKLLYESDIRHRDWFNDLIKLIEYGTQFEGELNPDACVFNQWFSSIPDQDKKLSELFDELKSAHMDFHMALSTIVEADPGQRKSLFIKKFRYINNFAKKYQDIRAHMDTKIDETSILEDNHYDQLLISAEKIVERLNMIGELENNKLTQNLFSVEEAKSVSMKYMIGIILSALLFTLFMSIYMKKSMVRPLKNTSEMIEKCVIGESDLTKRLNVKSGGDSGELVRVFNTFMDKQHDLIKNVKHSADVMLISYDDISGTTDQMNSGVDHMSSKSKKVVSAAEEMNSKITLTADSVEQAASSVNTAATATEEMTATINEIAQNTDKARSITMEAVSQAKNASVKVSEFGNASQEIGKVTDTITEISDQTNLLALNATIEAARAGDAGKGFAVVANEIKELARQTAEATKEIREKIEINQESMAMTVKEIKEITQVINDVNEIVSTIASALKEQSTTTQEIAGSVAQASNGIKELNQNMSQSSSAADGIAKEIVEVSQLLGELTQRSSKINVGAEESIKTAEQLKKMISGFKV